MNAKEIKEQLAILSGMNARIEDTYIENGGEVTEETEAMEARRDAVRELLTGDGIDALGRWLRSVEDSKAALKDEKAALDRMIKAKDSTISYIKWQVSEILKEAGIDKAKGTAYSFTRTISTTTSVDKARLLELYGEKVDRAIREAGIPDYIGVSLSASVKAVPEGEALPDIFIVSQADTATFRKPRKDTYDE